MEELNQLKDTFIPILIDWGLNIVWAIVILVIGWAASKWFANRTRKLLERTDRVSDTLDPLLVNIVRFGVLSIAALMILNRFGVETASVIALLGTIGLAIGLALQGSLSNVASGIMILALRPFKVGDSVRVKGRRAVVDEIGLFVTEMHTFDNVALTVTNTKVWSDVIENHSIYSTRRVDMIFRIDYKADLDYVFDIVREVLATDERVLDEPEPFLGVQNLADSWVNIYVRPWTANEDRFGVLVDMRKKIKNRFDEEGIDIPFPQQVEHHRGE